jgi:hypothetical protein
MPVTTTRPALLVLEHAVDADNRLHRVVTLHRPVQTQRMYARRIKTGEPHVAHDDELERIRRLFRTFFQPFLGQAAGTYGRSKPAHSRCRSAILIAPFSERPNDKLALRFCQVRAAGWATSSGCASASRACE